MSELNIHQRINAVMKVVEYIKKDTKVGSGQYAYSAISHDAVVGLIRKHCIETGILIIPSQQSKGESVAGKTKNGADKIRFEAVYDVAFVNIDKPEDRHIVSVEAHGEDSNDKAPGKAISYATKTAILKAFMIETGENDEKRIDDGSNSGNNQNINQSSDADKSGARKWLDEDIPAIRSIFNFDELASKEALIKNSIKDLYTLGFKDMHKEILGVIADQKKKIQERNEQNK